jgi:hypothetical protein
MSRLRLSLWPYLQGIDNAEIIDTVHARRARAPGEPVTQTLNPKPAAAARRA